jgi:hypothetical protein
VEHALYLADINQDFDPAGVDRLYFGAEFCEIKIPGVEETAAAALIAAESGLGFTLVTPYVTDRGLELLREVFLSLPADKPGEVVVNDYGALTMLKRERPDVTPVLGRLMSGQKRGFGVSTRQGDARPALAASWTASAFDLPAVREWLVEHGIRRVELDNLPQGIGSDFSGSGLGASLYAPFGFVTTTRYCPYAYREGRWLNISGECGRACRQGMIEERADIFDRPIWLAGNAQFYEFDNVPSDDELKKKGINRLIIERSIPV